MPSKPSPRSTFVPGLILILGAAAGCEPPWYPLPPLDDSATGSSTEASTTTGPSTTGTVTGVTTTNGWTGDGGDGSAGESESSGEPGETSGEPVSPPVIVDFELTPEPIVFAGMIAVTVQAEDAEGVRMALKNEEPVELAPGEEAGSFVGAIPALTGLWNGEHTATLTPWAGEVEGEAVAAAYTIELPTPGGQMLWEAGDLIGSGYVKALGVMPNGDVIEFGQHLVKAGWRCYLRRRDKGGAWTQSDVLDVMPGTECAPIDMKIDAKGSIFLLALRHTKSSSQWWLGELGSWGAGPKNRGLGAPDDTATALALATDGTLAVCGAVPTGLIDEFDAAAWIYRKDEGGEARVLDYRPVQKEPHESREIPRDCLFAGGKLVMAGEAHGPHEVGDQQPKRDRHFILEYDLATKENTWKVGGIEGSLQSGARALALDDEGRYVTAGFVCGDVCNPQATLRVQDPKGPLDWYATIAPLSSWPYDLAWSPAGYAVVAIESDKDNHDAFLVRAYKPGSGIPLWTFNRKDNKLFQLALTVAIGPFGQIYAGGIGVGSSPAVAYIAG